MEFKSIRRRFGTFFVDKVVEELIITIENIKGMDIFRSRRNEQWKKDYLCVQLMGYDIVLLAENGYEDQISLVLGLSDRDELAN